MDIYIHREGEQFGPYSVEQARDYLALGSLLPSDLAWHEGATEWMPLAKVEGVVSVAPSPPVSALATPTPSAWIPPRRMDSPSPQMASSALGPEKTVARTSRNGTNGAATAVPSSRVQRTSRRRSSPVDRVSRNLRASGVRNMVIGAIFCLGGAAVTAFTYELATTSSGGGSYIISWGAILFGGIRFVRGFIVFCMS